MDLLDLTAVLTPGASRTELGGNFGQMRSLQGSDTRGENKGAAGMAAQNWGPLQ